MHGGGTVTKIAWTDTTWNPIRGCSVVSAGCENCYAMRQAHRFSGPGQPYEGLTRMTGHGPKWTGKVMLVPEKLEEPLRWRKPRRVFVNSMSDLFHEDVPDEFIDLVFAAMAIASRHTYQLLTKRPSRMREYLSGIAPGGSVDADRWDEARKRFWIRASGTERERIGVALAHPRWPLPNVHLGVSVEDQRSADERIPLLLETPAAVRFVSCEPMLGPVAFRNPPTAFATYLDGLDWMIVGGESGPGARPCHVEWIRDIVRQCREAKVACFVKQVGSRPVVDGPERGWPSGRIFEPDSVFDEYGGSLRVKIASRGGADPDEWPEDLRVREFPENEVTR